MQDAKQSVNALLLSPYWSFWESSVTSVDLRMDREEIVAAAEAALEQQSCQITSAALVEPDGDKRIPAADAVPDVVVVVVTMAAPPTAVTQVLAALPQSIPIVVWAVLLPELGSAGPEGIVRNGATVGTPLLTAALHRQGRPFHVVAGSRTSAVAARVALVARAMTLAARLPELTLARVGDPLPGYVGVDADDQELTDAFGLEIRRIAPDELGQGALDVTEPELVAARGQMVGDIEDSPADVDMSLRLHAALRSLSDDLGVDCGAMSCHGDDLRRNPDIGITPCYALGMETSRGRPWTCTGDVVTAVAMLIAKRLSGASLYHEVESLDPRTGCSTLANTGEFDLAWAHEKESVQVRANPWYLDDDEVGLAVSHDLQPGPATLVAVVNQPDHPSGFRIVTSLGEVLPRHGEQLPTAGGVFKFAGDDPVAQWEGWVAAGATHHSALAIGDVAEGIVVLAETLGVDVVTLPHMTAGR